MKKQFVLFSLLAGLLYVVLVSYAEGPGVTAGVDGTGASGVTGCSCHGPSATTGITVTMELDSAGVSVNHYIAGNAYTIKITGTNTTASSLPKFGFQIEAVKLTGAGTGTAVNAGTLPTVGLPTSCQNSTVGGRHLVEHSARLSPISGSGGSGTIYSESIAWTAPVAGTGTVKLYGVINAVNADGGSSGDSWNTNHTSITEMLNPITGTTTLCASSTTTLADLSTGGTWSSSNTLVATVTGTGVVTGIGAGTANITYTIGGSNTTTLVTVTGSPAPITGNIPMCSGSTLTLADATTGGTWSGGGAIATVDAVTGIVTSTSTGTATVTYSNGCGTPATITITVNGSPTLISGNTPICAGGATLSLADATTGGTWSGGTVGIATIDATTGVVTSGTTAGTTSVTYSNGCGADAVAIITINAMPSVITGISSVCEGGEGTTTLSDATVLATWSSSNAALATIDPSTGVVTGVANGTPTISYTLTSTGCYVTQSLTVNPMPAAITGSAAVCEGSEGTTTLSDATLLGTWSSSNTALATIGATTGVVTGVSTGAPIISYSITATGCFRTTALTVNPRPAVITGSALVCETGQGTTTLSDATTLGTWSSSNTALATIGATTGVVTGVTFGTPTISYTETATGCYRTTILTVNPVPSTITGTASVCESGEGVTTLSDVDAGGTWSSNNIAFATITPVSGVVTGVANGTSIITYQFTVTGCYQTTSLTVNPKPAPITGTPYVCAGGIATTTLSDATILGTWSSSNTALATITPSTGVLSGVVAGTPIITYQLTATSCYQTIPVTVNSLPVAGALTGVDSLCAGGGIITLTPSASGGTWSATNGLATVVGGAVSGIAAGIDTIIYTISSTSCGNATATKAIKIIAQPIAGAITGLNNVCVSDSIPLTDGVSGGVWSSSNLSIATVSGGNVRGVSAGIDSILYTVTNYCNTAIASHVITVNPLPTASSITGGSTNICIGAPATFSDATTGGTWASSNPAIATIGTSTGIVNGIATGIDTISYTVTNTCGSATQSTTINVSTTATAGSISGSATVCLSATTSLSDGLTGGNWYSADTSIVKIDSVSGIVTGVALGVSTISYKLVSACGTAYATKGITVITVPATPTITGTVTMCFGGVDTLTGIATGGAWASSNGAIAIIDPTTGIVTATGTGNVFITYTLSNTCGSVHAIKAITVNALPTVHSILGLSAVCFGTNLYLYDSTASGTWSSSNTLVATIGASTGIVTTVASGSTTISYTATNICGNTVMTKAITVATPADSGIISGAASVCVSDSITLTESVSTGSWFAVNGMASVVNGVVHGIATGIDTIQYTVTNVCGTATTQKIITVNPLPDAGSISGLPIVCTGSSITLTDGAAGGTWSGSSAVALVNPATGVISGIVEGLDSVFYTVSNSCGMAKASVVVTINPLPVAGTVISSTGAMSVCVGANITLIPSASGGTWILADSNAIIDTATNMVTGLIAGTDSIVYTFTNYCSTASTSFILTINPLPTIGAIEGIDSVCIGTNIVLTDIGGGLWSTSDTNASITDGIVTGLHVGTDSIFYTVSNICATITASKLITVITTPNTGIITGFDSVCTMGNLLLTDTIIGGVWSSSNITVATVDTGRVSGVHTGNTIISYTLTNVCGSHAATHSVFVRPVPNAGTISGLSNVCKGLDVTLTDTIAGGVWVSGGVVTTLSGNSVHGNLFGIDTVTYTITTVCGNASTNFVIQVDTTLIATITGRSYVCVNGYDTLSGQPLGGTWSTSNPNAVMIWNMVKGMTQGIDTIYYSVNNACGTATAQMPINIDALPDAGNITGTINQICVGATVSLTESLTGGTWATDTTIASITTGGVVTGVAAGTDSVAYMVTNMCGSSYAKYGVVVSILLDTPIILQTHDTLFTTATYATYQWYADSTIVPGATNFWFTPNGNPAKYTVTVTNGGGCTVTSGIFHWLSVPIVNGFVNNVNIYPNPTQSKIYLQSATKVDAQLATIDGRIIIDTKNIKEIDLTTLPNGIYFITVFDNQTGIKMKADRVVKTGL